jgi:hypothetical protein
LQLANVTTEKIQDIKFNVTSTHLATQKGGVLLAHVIEISKSNEDQAIKEASGGKAGAAAISTHLPIEILVFCVRATSARATSHIGSINQVICNVRKTIGGQQWKQHNCPSACFVHKDVVFAKKENMNNPR